MAPIRKALVISLILSSLFVIPEPADAFWIWSPKKGTFENPKKKVKPVPTDQFTFALSFFEAGDYERALREMKNLVASYPASKEAAEAQYYIGRSYEGLEDYDAAFKAYEKVISRYPNSQRIGEVVEREYRIGNLFYSGKKRKIAGLEILPSLNKAIEVFQRVVEQFPYGPYGVLAQYKLGECYKKTGETGQAKEAFEKLIEDYPTSELVDEARYQIALVSLQVSKGASYDDRATNEALTQFSRFVKEHPDSDLIEESIKAIETLKERKAQKIFETAKFYEKQQNAPAAKIYYNEVIEQYGSSSWAQRALEQLTILEKESATP